MPFSMLPMTSDNQHVSTGIATLCNVKRNEKIPAARSDPCPKATHFQQSNENPSTTFELSY